MKTLLVVLLALGLAACKTVAPPAPQVIVAPLGPRSAEQLAAQAAEIVALKDQVAALQDLLQRAAGSVFAAIAANAANPPGFPQAATAAQLAEAASALPVPTAEQKAAKEKQNALMLTGNLAAGQAELAQGAAQNQTLATTAAAAAQRAAAAAQQVSTVAPAAQQERAGAAAELQAQFTALTDQVTAAQRQAAEATKAANERQRTLITWIFFGGAALCAIAAAIVATLGNSVPIFGPRIAIGLGIAAGLLFGLGMAMRLIDRMLDEHPYVFWGSLAGVAAVLGAAAILAYANHKHAAPVPT